MEAAAAEKLGMVVWWVASRGFHRVGSVAAAVAGYAEVAPGEDAVRVAQMDRAQVVASLAEGLATESPHRRFRLGTNDPAYAQV